MTSMKRLEEIIFHHRASLYTCRCKCRILIQPQGMTTFNVSEDMSAALLENQRCTQHSLHNSCICVTVFRCYKNCSLPVIFRVKSWWRHSKQAAALMVVSGCSSENLWIKRGLVAATVHSLLFIPTGRDLRILIKCS